MDCVLSEGSQRFENVSRHDDSVEVAMRLPMEDTSNKLSIANYKLL